MTDTTGTAATLFEAAHHWLETQNLPLREEDGRLLTAVPLNEDRSLLLRVSLGTTDATNDLVARAHPGVEVARADWQRALWLSNRWNRTQPSPRASLLVNDWDNDQTGSFLLDAWLPAGGDPSVDQVDRFVQTFVRGATSFARDPKVRGLGKA